MRQSTCAERQIVSILEEVDSGRPVNEIWRACGVLPPPTSERPNMGGWRSPISSG
jgi:hypothetical protein